LTSFSRALSVPRPLFGTCVFSRPSIGRVCVFNSNDGRYHTPQNVPTLARPRPALLSILQPKSRSSRTIPRPTAARASLLRAPPPPSTTRSRTTAARSGRVQQDAGRPSAAAARPHAPPPALWPRWWPPPRATTRSLTAT
jgi:hypothetical protein